MFKAVPANQNVASRPPSALAGAIEYKLGVYFVKARNITLICDTDILPKRG